MPKHGQVKFTLLENGMDFISSALEHLTEEASKRTLKYAVLHLSAGIELVLKERLRQEHWALVFADPDKADSAAYEAGDFVSADLGSTLDRLAGICGVELEDNERRTLINFRKRRNRLEHFGTVDSFEAIVASSVEALDIVVDFVTEELDPEQMSKTELELLGKVRSRLGELEAFVQKRLKNIKDVLKSETRTIATCPLCAQQALALDDVVECHFCGQKTGAESAAEEFVTRILGESYYHVAKDGGEWPVAACPECERESLVDTRHIGDTSPAVRYICFACGGKWDDDALEQCSRCSRYMRISDIGVCGECFSAVVNRDD
jgi:hypothetical protein